MTTPDATASSWKYLYALYKLAELGASRRTVKVSSWLSEILASIERTWSNLRRFTTVIPAGGGSIVLGDILRLALISKGAAVSWPEDPSTTNVKGLWKWGAYGR